jgi:GNAT superfamily N-acetyltransferase
MQAEARQEGYTFLETLVDEWMSGENRFDGPGETLLGFLDDGHLSAIGGLNCDPFLADPNVGRIRRLYVRAGWRGKGIGGSLVDNLLSAAAKSFCCVRLRAESARAARLYERMGFVPCDSDSATHILHFEKR